MSLSVQEYIRNNIQKEAMGDASGMAEIGSVPSSGGLMNTETARDKKWNPQRMIPSNSRSVRPHDSLAARFGPSVEEMALNLPTAQQMLQSRNQAPKFIRTVAQHKRSSGDLRPIVVPKSGDDAYWKGRPNRPRVTEAHFKDAVEADKRFFGQLQGQ